MAKKQTKKVAPKKATKEQIIKTDDLPKLNFGEAIRAMLKAKKKE